MSEASRRTAYLEERILITAERILDPQFNAQGITLDGAQVELLRNVVGYLRRDTTFVDEYEAGYYLKVTDDDFDDISAIVADLESKLMQNDNTLMGYAERYLEQIVVNNAPAGTNIITSDAVPAGELYIVTTICVIDVESAPTSIRFGIDVDGTRYYGGQNASPAAGRWYTFPGEWYYAEDDKVLVVFDGVTLNDTLIVNIWGRKMIVDG